MQRRARKAEVRGVVRPRKGDAVNMRKQVAVEVQELQSVVSKASGDALIRDAQRDHRPNGVALHHDPHVIHVPLSMHLDRDRPRRRPCEARSQRTSRRCRRRQSMRSSLWPFVPLRSTSVGNYCMRALGAPVRVTSTFMALALARCADRSRRKYWRPSDREHRFARGRRTS